MINYCAFKELIVLYCRRVISVDAKISSGSYFYFIFRSYIYIISVQFNGLVMYDSLRPHELQHAGPPCRSPTPGVYPNIYIYIYILCVSLVVSYSVISSRSPVEFILCLKNIKFVGRQQPLDVYIQFFL